MKKILLALQYWDGDRDQALRLLDLFSKTIEPENKYADLLLFCRNDSTLPTEETIEKLKRPFSKVWCMKSKNVMHGWPNGCNQLWADLITEAYIRYSQSSTQGDPEWSCYKAIFTIESDCCPIKPSWLQELSEEWDKLNACVVGTWLQNNDEHGEIGHINGNAMFCMDILKKQPFVNATPYDKAWDTYHAKSFKEAGWASTPKIVSIHKTPTLSPEEYNKLKKTECVFLHGVKDDSVIQMFLNEKAR